MEARSPRALEASMAKKAAEEKSAEITVEGIFGPGGPLEKRHPGYDFRASQLAMAKLAEEAFDKHQNVIVEAGTGTGTVASSPSGINCGSTCSSTYSSGTAVSLSATPASGQVFSGWSGACSGTGACGVTMSSNQSVTATFDPAPPPQYTTTITTSGTATGTITSSPAGINCGTTCSASFDSGTSLVLTASPASGYVFSGWGGSSCSGSGNCTVTVSSNLSVSANFVSLYTLSVSKAGTGTGRPRQVQAPGQAAFPFAEE